MNFLVIRPDRIKDPKIKKSPQSLFLADCQRKRVRDLATDLYYELLKTEKLYAQRSEGNRGMYGTVYINVPGSIIEQLLRYI
ncbi:hypothetical protein [Stenotrophomonas phage BUCT608]|nr:hypothetical protein [Stenotrophomonas phage BUCT608]QYC97492.1 hypothetical protein [Stenotrophomonas phage BUCT608]